MDQLNRLLAWAAYVVGGVILGLGLYAAFQHYRLEGVERQAASEGVGGGGTTAAPVQVVRGAHLDVVYELQAQNRKLQSLLRQKTELLDKRTELLQEKLAEQKTLRQELDQTMMLAELLAAEVSGEGSGDGTKPPLNKELERLRAEVQESQRLAEQRQLESEALLLELAETDEEIEYLEGESELQFAVLLSERQAFEDVVAGVLAGIGDSAVPILEEHLGHARPDVRAWAAEMLGQIGAPSRVALPTLVETVTDPDADVRAAARQAIQRIESVSDQRMPADGTPIETEGGLPRE